MCFLNYKRRETRTVNIGNIPLGSDYVVRIQSMANVSTMDTEAAVRQAKRMADAGSEYVRFTAQGEREATNLGEIRKDLNDLGCMVPLIADIHFNPRAADVSAVQVEKVRINPGNYAPTYAKIKDKFVPFLKLCKENHTAIRIGVNHGSLSNRMMEKYGDTTEGMIASVKEFLDICEAEDFHDIVISVKSSNTSVMVQTVRALVKVLDAKGLNYPLHLGVTEAGEGEDGRVKSAVGIGTLLADGIGDTIRVSLSEEPEAELPVAQKLIDYINVSRKNVQLIEDRSGSENKFSEKGVYLSRVIDVIGGSNVPIVVADVSKSALLSRFEPKPDLFYIGSDDAHNWPNEIPLAVNFSYWKNQPHTYPVFLDADRNEVLNHKATLKFISLDTTELSPEWLAILEKDKNTVLWLRTSHHNVIGSFRRAIIDLHRKQIKVPIVLHRTYEDTDLETFQVKAGVDFGALVLDGNVNGLMATCPSLPAEALNSCLFGILQATRKRISRTEYISCPGCGRTLYDLQTAVARVKSATGHLKGLKIAVMGCIVNGPGEMADADYGYVGSGKGKISLYKAGECVKKNISEEEAPDQLAHLIMEHGDWKE
ncbi:MAG: (E)-4-hydroxy-3-methylbut-2-enyl-diphosphate synthase [Massilibacteroides sp.]|nr:(E)-4-hydroxy-3-methylbut-2-enyl-diphosphate synthase [Massilibacteroides sp.]